MFFFAKNKNRKVFVQKHKILCPMKTTKSISFKIMTIAFLAAALVALASVHASTIFAQSSQGDAGAVSHKSKMGETGQIVTSLVPKI